LTLTGALYAIEQFAIKLDKTSPLNCMNQHTLTLDTAFTTQKRILNHKAVKGHLQLKTNSEFRRLMSFLFFYLGDCERGISCLG
jgi:hypothetical protein